jgi:hypothetical protein
MMKFSVTTETIIDLATSKKLNLIWANNALGNGTSTFLFKFHNNTAGYNLAIQLQLLFQCPAVEFLTKEIFSWLLNTNAVISRLEFFTPFNRADHRKNDFLTLFSKLYLKYYWDCKQRFYLPNLSNAKLILISELSTIIQCNPKIRLIYKNSGIDFNRE